MKKILISTAALCMCLNLSSSRIYTQEEREQFFQRFTDTIQGQDLLKNITNSIIDTSSTFIRDQMNSSMEMLGSVKNCMLCKTTFTSVDSLLRTETLTNALESFAILICNQVESTNTTVCPGAVKEMGDIIIPVLTDFLLSPDYMCNRILTACNDVEFQVLDDLEFVNRVLADKPDIIKNNDYIDNLYKNIKTSNGRKTFKAVHYSDVHVDFEYVPGTDAQCTQPLCCRLENGYPEDPKNGAGEWGSYLCDPPHKTITKMFEYIRDEIKPDVLFWTGDMTPHNVWENTEDEVTMYQYVISKEMQEIFGKDLMIYPLQGNHDTWPVNVQSFSVQNPTIANLTTVWDYWLYPETIQTFKKAGYYAQYFELWSTGQKFSDTRVIAVSTNTCNDQNWYLWEVLSDPGDEIAWLESILKDMEAKGEKAILLGHMPGNSCLRAWAIRFQSLIERYQHVVRFGLYGHSHSESFFLSRNVNLNGDITSTKPFMFNSIMGPTTTYTGNNPSFAVYEIDEETMLVVNITTYFFNVTKANLGQPEWELYHNILADYGMEDASPSSFHAFAQKLLNDEEAALKYINWNSKGGPDGYRTSCDGRCRLNIYCDVTTNFKEDRSNCNNNAVVGLESQYERMNLFSFDKYGKMLGFSTGDMYETMADPWLVEIKK